MASRLFLLLLLVAPALPAADAAVESARAKLALIEDDKAAPGSVIVFTPEELNAWVRAELAAEPEVGLREPKIELADGTVSFQALAEFQKLADGEGGLFARLMEGERKVKIVAQPETSAGRVTIRLNSVMISGIPLSGVLLSWAARLVLSHVYEEGEIDQPFEMGHNIDHAVVEAMALRVYIKE